MTLVSRVKIAGIAVIAPLPLMLGSCSLVSSDIKDPVEYTLRSAVEEPFKADVISSFDDKKISESELEKSLGVEIYGDTTPKNVQILYSASTILAKNTRLFSSIDTIVFVPEKYLSGINGITLSSSTIKIQSNKIGSVRQTYVILHEASHAYSCSLSNTSFWNEWVQVTNVSYFNHFPNKQKFIFLQKKFIPHDGSMSLYGLKNPQEHVAELTAYVTMINDYSAVPKNECETFRKYISLLTKYQFVSQEHKLLAEHTLK